MHPPIAKRANHRGAANAILLAVIALLTAVVTNADRLAVLWNVVFLPGPPPPSPEWKHFTSKSAAAMEAYLNNAQPSPNNVAAFTSWPDIHVWHRGGKSGTQYSFKLIPYNSDLYKTANFFFNDGTIVPAGFAADNVAYLQVVAK
jgi:hypothetical protein